MSPESEQVQSGFGDSEFHAQPEPALFESSALANTYFSGDTGFFSDMARVSDYNEIDIMLVCIGDHFTMGPIRAADAVKAVGPKVAIPMHYATFPVLTGTPETFAEELKKRPVKTELRVMNVGETITF